MILRLSIVVPTFNEAQNIETLCRQVESALGPEGWELVFVDDDSPDGTASIVRSVAQLDTRVRCVQRVGRRGLSSACVEGMLSSSGPAIAVLDGDLQHDERILPIMLGHIERGAELVVATRYADGGSVGAWDERRHLMSRVAGRMSRWVVRQKVSDPMSGFFMLRRGLIEEVLPRLSCIGFKILVDILASSRRDIIIAEVPYSFRNRSAGESKLDEMAVWEFAMLLADKTFGRFVPVRFLAFAIVGGVGVSVHMSVLAVAHLGLHQDFGAAQTVATVVAMVFNFAVNNVLTYRDRRLAGRRWLQGLVSYVLVCSVGAVANVGVATYLFSERAEWVLAALAGIAVGAVWNYALTRFYIWGRER